MKLINLQESIGITSTYAELLGSLEAQGLGPDFVLEDGNTILHFLCAGKDLSLSLLSDVLQNTKIGVDQKNYNGERALSTLLNNLSIKYITRLKAARVFLIYGANPDYHDKGSLTPRTLLHSPSSGGPWGKPLLSDLSTRILSIEDDFNEHSYRSSSLESTRDDMLHYPKNLEELINDRDLVGLEEELKNNNEYTSLRKKAKYIDIVLNSDWGNLYSADDDETLRLLIKEGFFIDETNLFNYIIKQKSFLNDILSLVREYKPELSRTISIWLLVSKELSGDDKLLIIKDIVRRYGEDDITEEIKSSIVFIEEESIKDLVDVVFSSKAKVRWSEVMEEYVLANSEILSVQVDEVLSANRNIIYKTNNQATKEEINNLIEKIQSDFTLRR